MSSTAKQGTSSEQQPMAAAEVVTPGNNVLLKIMAKKDSTEHMLKALISRTHTPKPLQYSVKHHDKFPISISSNCQRGGGHSDR